MKAAIVLFNRDLRVGDHPALAEAHRVAEHVVPLFVADDAITSGSFASPNRNHFLVESLADLRASLRYRGADLIVRRGEPVAAAVAVAAAVGADAIFTSADVTGYAQRRQARLAAACQQHRLAFSTFPGVTVVGPESPRPSGGGDHYKVFTPYWNAWQRAPRRPVAPGLRRLRLPDGLDPGPLPTDRGKAPRSPNLPAGGERAARARVNGWVRSGLGRYGDRHDDLAGDSTSGLGPYLHLGCVSPLEVVRRVAEVEGSEPFVRQMCWRDFHHQVTASFPAIATADYRPRGHVWRDDPDAALAWKEGRTGYPIVDAGMRQLRAEGAMHNRARLIVASFLTRDLHLDWRIGAAHFLYWLVDGDIANNSGNWQWVAGTGNDTRPNRKLNPLRQAARFDPDGDYVRRHLPELAGVAGPGVHQPWTLPPAVRRALEYPPPIVDP